MSARQYVVLGEAPTHDVPVAVGPFRSAQRAEAVVNELIWRGFNAYSLELQTLDEVEPSIDWSDEGLGR